MTQLLIDSYTIAGVAWMMGVCAVIIAAVALSLWLGDR